MHLDRLWVAMAAMAGSAPVGARSCAASCALASSSLKGEPVHVKLGSVRRAVKAGALEVVMTATLPPRFK